MNNEEKILSLLETLTSDMATVKDDVSTLKGDVSTLKGDVSTLKDDVSTLKDGHARLEKKVDNIDATVVRMEADHGYQLGALKDGVLQNHNRLERIENEVTRHEEIIIRKVK